MLEYRADARPGRTLPRRGASRAAAPGGAEVGVAVIGAGGFARAVLLPQLVRQAGVRLAGVCTRRGSTADDAARRFGFGVATTDPARLLDDAGVRAVIVATRHASHASLTAAALRAGKHVFVEKPLCLSDAELDEVERALDDARTAGRDPCLMVGFNRRFSPHARAIRTAFADRVTPMVVSYRVSAGAVPADSWLADPGEGDRIVGEGCHFVDFCTALVGSEPRAVTAQGVASGRGDAAAPSVMLAVRYADGSLATIQYLTVGHPRLAKERCEVFADDRTAVLDDFRVTRFHGGGRTVRGRQAKGFVEELQAFLDACRGGPWPIPWSSLTGTHRVCFAAARSLETGGAVRLPAAPAA